MTKYKQINRMILDVDPSISHEKAAYYATASAYAYASYTAYASYASASYAYYATASTTTAAYASYASASTVDRKLLEKLFKDLVFNDLSSQQLKNEVLNTVS